jgi:hypothetical protein
MSDLIKNFSKIGPEPEKGNQIPLYSLESAEVAGRLAAAGAVLIVSDSGEANSALMDATATKIEHNWDKWPVDRLGDGRSAPLTTDKVRVALLDIVDFPPGTERHRRHSSVFVPDIDYYATVFDDEKLNKMNKQMLKYLERMALREADMPTIAMSTTTEMMEQARIGTVLQPELTGIIKVFENPETAAHIYKLDNIDGSPANPSQKEVTSQVYSLRSARLRRQH